MKDTMAKKPKAKMNAPEAPPPMKPKGMPDFMQRAKRPGGMKKGGKVKAMPMRAFKGKK